jgi:AcrR family transcriptional regulator
MLRAIALSPPFSAEIMARSIVKPVRPPEPDRLRVDTLTPRALRSREKLKAAAVTLINRAGYPELRVQDITQEAGVANGLFYRYFRDLNEIVAEITGDMFDRIVHSFDHVEPDADIFRWMVSVHDISLAVFAANPGILSCLFGKSGDDETFAAIWAGNAHMWNVQVADRLAEIMPRPRAESTAFVLGAVTEGMIYQALVRRTDDLLEITGGTTAGLAELIATTWYKIVFLADPPAAALSVGRRLTGDASA